MDNVVNCRKNSYARQKKPVLYNIKSWFNLCVIICNFLSRLEPKIKGYRDHLSFHQVGKSWTVFFVNPESYTDLMERKVNHKIRHFGSKGSKEMSIKIKGLELQFNLKNYFLLPA